MVEYAWPRPCLPYRSIITIRTGYRHDAEDRSSAIAASAPLAPPPTIATTGPLAASWLFNSCTVPAYTTNSIGYIDNTGAVREHPPRIGRHRNVSHSGDSSTPTDGQLIPDYTQLGFRVPAIVVSNLSHHHVVKTSPYEHTSSLALIESAFGLPALTARDANARNLAEILKPEPRTRVNPSVIPTSAQVPGPANDAAAVCSASSVQSVSPQPVRHGSHPHDDAERALYRSGYPSGSGMADLGKELKKAKNQLKP